MRVIELAGTHPLADEAARHAARAAWDSVADGSRPIIDGLALPAFVGLDDALAARDTVGLIHHPTALETGFSETERTALLGTEKRLLAKMARVIVTSGPTAERLTADFGIDRDRIKVVVPGTDECRAVPVPPDRPAGIISIGTLVRARGMTYCCARLPGCSISTGSLPSWVQAA